MANQGKIDESRIHARISALSDRIAAMGLTGWTLEPTAAAGPLRVHTRSAKGITASRVSLMANISLNEPLTCDPNYRYTGYFSDRPHIVRIGDRAPQRVKANEMVIVHSCEPIHATFTSHYTATSLTIDSAIFERNVRHPELFRGRSFSDREQINVALSSIVQCAFGLIDNDMIEHSATMIADAFMNMCNVYGAAQGSTALPLRAQSMDRTQAAQWFIRRNFRQPWCTVASVSRALGISPRYLAKIMEAEGQSAHERIASYRLEAAAQWLAQEDDLSTITDIAMGVGYGSSAHFSTEFKRRFGMSPRDYRRLKRSIR